MLANFVRIICEFVLFVVSVLVVLNALVLILGDFSCFNMGPSVFLAVFIYSMPGYTCSIKERMLYSSCKNRLLDEVERDYQLEVTKKVHMQDQIIPHCSSWFSSAVC